MAIPLRPPRARTAARAQAPRQTWDGHAVAHSSLRPGKSASLAWTVGPSSRTGWSLASPSSPGRSDRTPGFDREAFCLRSRSSRTSATGASPCSGAGERCLPALRSERLAGALPRRRRRDRRPLVLARGARGPQGPPIRPPARAVRLLGGVRLRRRRPRAACGRACGCGGGVARPAAATWVPRWSSTRSSTSAGGTPSS